MVFCCPHLPAALSRCISEGEGVTFDLLFKTNLGGASSETWGRREGVAVQTDTLTLQQMQLSSKGCTGSTENHLEVTGRDIELPFYLTVIYQDLLIQ